MHSHSEVAYWTVCGHFVESGWLIFSQKAIPHKARVPAQSSFHKQVTETRKDGLVFHMSASGKNFQSFAVICRKTHVAGSICLRATIFQNPECTLWTHCTLCFHCMLFFAASLGMFISWSSFFVPEFNYGFNSRILSPVCTILIRHTFNVYGHLESRKIYTCNNFRAEPTQ
jgi:hypothetical protein